MSSPLDVVDQGVPVGCSTLAWSLVIVVRPLIWLYRCHGQKVSEPKGLYHRQSAYADPIFPLRIYRTLISYKQNLQEVNIGNGDTRSNILIN